MLTLDEAKLAIERNLIVEESTELVESPVVSVSIITFNHAKYVEEAIESVLSQETSFAFEIVIGDDCSTDGTIEILKRYQREHPDRIRLLLFKENLGVLTGNGRLNFLCNLSRVRGQYVAMLEGDDYWCDRTKLQSQVSLLEKETKLSASFELSKRINSDGSLRSVQGFQSSTWDTKAILNHVNGCPFHTCSIVYRKIACKPFEDWFVGAPVGDWLIVSLLSEYGDIACVNRSMSCYRIHGEGLWSKMNHIRQARMRIAVFKLLKRHFGVQYKTQTDYGLSYNRWQLAKLLDAKEKRRSATTLKKSVFRGNAISIVKLLALELAVRPGKAILTKLIGENG